MRVFHGTSDLPVFGNAVLTIGSFDGVHCGHQKILSRLKALAKETGGESVVITFEPHPRLVLHPSDTSVELLTTTEEKVALFERFGVDNVVVVRFDRDFANLSPEQYIKEFLVAFFNPRHIIIGYDHRFGAGRKGDIQYLRQFEKIFGFTIIEIEQELVNDLEVSSTKIRHAIRHKDIETANRLSGHPYLLGGIVVHGDKIGQKLGFPTANVRQTDQHKLIPPEGIYACYTLVDGRRYQAMLYIGRRPAVATDGKPVSEVHLFDFEGDLYNKNITIEVENYVREDLNLDSLTALSAQLHLDRAAVLEILKKKRRA